MGDIGEVERTIEVLPAEDPWPAPDPEPQPVPVPEKDPAEVPA